MRIYSCGAGMDWEGTDITFVTTNEENAINFCSEIIKSKGGSYGGYQRDWAGMEVWEDEEMLYEVNYSDKHPNGKMIDYRE